MEYIVYLMTACPFCKTFLPLYGELVGGKEIVLDDYNDPRWEGIEVVPTVVAYEGGKEIKRIEAVAGVGIGEKEFRDWFAGA